MDGKPVMSGMALSHRSPLRSAAIAACMLAFAAVAILAYLPALQNGFLSWDDHLYVTGNPLIQNIDANFFRRIFTEPVAANYHPLTIVSHALDFALWGMNPRGHHLTNVLFHGLNTALVFLLLLVLFQPPKDEALWRSREAWSAALAALLFGLHPIHVESVAWVAERKDLLYAAFYLLSLLAYVRYTRSQIGRPMFYLASVLCFLLSLLSKPMAVTLPLVLLILDGYPLGRIKAGTNGAPTPIRRILIEKAPFVLLSLVFSVTTLWAQERNVVDVPLFFRLPMAAYASLFYLAKLAWPVDLAPYYPYPYPPLSRIEISSWALLAGAVVFCGLTVFLWLHRNSRQGLFSAWGLYVAQLLPVIGIIQVGGQFAADRYVYLACLPAFYPACWFLVGLGQRQSVLRRVGIVIAAVVVLVILGSATWRQSALWRDMITLWDHEVRIHPEGVALVYFNRGNGYYEAGRYQPALRDFSKALEIDPSFIKARVNRGDAHMKLGNADRAILDFTNAIESGPENKEISYAHNNRGTLFIARGDHWSAIRDFSMAIELDDRNAFARQNRGRSFLMLQAYGDAVRDLSRALELSPADVATHADLAAALQALGREQEAAFHFQEAKRLGWQFDPPP